MMKIGSYNITVNTAIPENVKLGFNNVFKNILGATYTPIAYLGSKVVNGINHAILVQQDLTLEKDTNSISLIILNEKPNSESFSIVAIEPIISNGGDTGGLVINPTTNIPTEALEVFNKHFGGYLGANNRPFALLGTQIINGICYVYAVESDMVINEGNPISGNTNLLSINKAVNIVKLYTNFNTIEITEVISGVDGNKNVLRYAFNWLPITSNWP